jgi:hypothetical protein
VTLLETEFLELMILAVKHVSASLDITQLLMDHASNPIATLIHSALSASKDLNFVFNALPPRTESLNYLKVFVCVWMDSMLIQAMFVSLAQLDVESALQQQTALVV